ncbi:glycosyltransferase family 4 protein [Kitasatospora sp. NPDC057015]|uniref:glycosyltransferase family 4 protein n=1 Tax=Kitasatospora sp. NPDC057015 TaxID=3346001 RepID=UPI00362BFB06
MSDAASHLPAGARPRVLHVISDPRRRGAQSFARDLDRELRRRGQASALRALAPPPDAPASGRPRDDRFRDDRFGTGAPGCDQPCAGAACAGAAGSGSPGSDALDAGPPLTAGAPTGPPGEARTAVLGPGRLHPRTLRALRAAARTADVVVAHGCGTLTACALALAGTRTPFVHVATGDPRSWGTGSSGRLRTRALLRRAAAVTARSDEARAVLIDRFRLPGTLVRTIPNGRSADRYPPALDAADRRAARSALGLPAEGLLVAWVGAITAEKRLDLAMAAVCRMPDVRLAVAGDGPLRTALEPRHDGARAIFLGHLADPAPLYRAADALLLTGGGEGVPGVLIEAGLAGLPAVATATEAGPVRSAVRDGVSGALAPPGDPAALAEALAKVLAGDRPALGAAAREHVLPRFELGVVADAWQGLLAEVARPGRG